MVRKDPRDWEALYREGVALASLSKPEEAARRFRALLDLKVDEDEKSAIVKARTRDPKLQAAGARPSNAAQVKPTPFEERIQRQLSDPHGDEARGPRILLLLAGRRGDLVAPRLRPGPDGGPRLDREPGAEGGPREGGGGPGRLPRGQGQDAPRPARPRRLVSDLPAPQRLSRQLRGESRPEPRRPLRPDRALGLPDLARLADARHGGPILCRPRLGERRRHAAARGGRARARPLLLSRPQAAPAGDGPGDDPQQHRRRAEAGQAGRGRRPLLSRVARGGRALAAGGVRLRPRRAAGRRRRPDPALRQVRAAPGRQGGDFVLLFRLVLLRGDRRRGGAGDERPRGRQGLRRRPQAARPHPGRVASQERESSPGSGPRGEIRQPVPRRLYAVLSGSGPGRPSARSRWPSRSPTSISTRARSRS